MTKPKVFLTGGDNENWALDDDLRLTRRALEAQVDFTANIRSCDVVHAMWWSEIAGTPAELLLGKRVICHVPGEPFRYLAEPGYSAAAAQVGHWIVRSHQALTQMTQMGQPATFIPYTCDSEIFRPLRPADPQLAELRAKWQIPAQAYLVGNFHRDTEGNDLASPKLVKGPDIFLEIMRAAAARLPNLHVVLAGPRRYWLRRRLAEFNIPFTFVGEWIEGRDDTDRNILPRSTLNLLYNLIDLYIVSSRSEGGPQSVMEAAFAKCKILSTPVGIAPDLLDPACIYRYPYEAAAALLSDAATNQLSGTLEANYAQAHAAYRPEAAAPLFQALYSRWQELPVNQGMTRRAASGPVHVQPTRPTSGTWKSRLKYQLRRNRLVARLWRRVIRPQLDRRRRTAALRLAGATGPGPDQPVRLTASLWHDFVPPPYGGGNQFMLALRRALITLQVRVVENQIGPEIDAYLLNSVHFDVERFVELQSRQRLAVVHRIDGPIHLVRGKDREQDELCFDLNGRLAAQTVIQSYWTYLRILEMGYHPVNPTIVHNAVDPAIFHPHGRVAFDRGRKIRLISSSWSDNPRKGGPLYKWLEDHLDWERFDYTFVGRASERFSRIRTVEPVPSEELAELLRQHDIYITASQNDPCSNALIEALACGLPALYLDDGGHPELVGQGGLPFHGPEDILAQLDLLVEHYATFQNLIAVASLDDVARRYLELLERAAADAERCIMNDIHLVLFLTRSTPLATWHKVGILEREAALYRQLRPLVGSIRVVTSGGPEELDYRTALGDAEILYNRHRLPPNVYSLLAPLLHRQALQAATLYKTNQLDGAWTAILAGRLYRKPVIVRAGYLWAPTFAKVAGRTWKTRLAHRLEHLALRQADAVILTTAAMKQQVAGQHGIAPDRISVIPNFVDTGLFRPDPQVTPRPGRILFVGRLEPEKNLAAVLEAMTQTPGASLALIGQGSQEPVLSAYAQQHGLVVEFLGRIPNTRLPEEIRRAEVFILPSLYEGHPKALIEAMACGAAVIGSDAPGIREVIRHEETGLLCPPDAAGIAAALRRLLADAELRARLGAAAQAAAERQYSLTSIVQTELALYRAVQGNGPRPAALPAAPAG